MSGKLPKYIPHVQACGQVLFCSQAQGRKLNAKIKDSRVSRIQMWREKNKKKTSYLKHGIRAFLQQKKKKGRGCIVSWVIENLLEMRLNRPK